MGIARHHTLQLYFTVVVPWDRLKLSRCLIAQLTATTVLHVCGGISQKLLCQLPMSREEDDGNRNKFCIKCHCRPDRGGAVGVKLIPKCSRKLRYSTRRFFCFG